MMCRKVTFVFICLHNVLNSIASHPILSYPIHSIVSFNLDTHSLQSFIFIITLILSSSSSSSPSSSPSDFLSGKLLVNIQSKYDYAPKDGSAPFSGTPTTACDNVCRCLLEVANTVRSNQVRAIAWEVG